MFRSNLCDYSDGYIVVKRSVTVEGDDNDDDDDDDDDDDKKKNKKTNL